MPIIPANWDEDDSDLTSLVSDDDLEDEQPPLPRPSPVISRPNITTRPSTKEATAKSQKKARTNPHLVPPRICQYSAHQLHKMLGEGCINLDPEYQRDVVWSSAKQTALIDSLIHNYYMPPIIFSVTYRCGDIPGKMVCIDGKQRLTSIKRFMDGEIPHKDTFSGRKSYFMNGPGQRRKLLTKPELQEFENQQIACVEYLHLTDEDEREIFQRVQMGVALTPAERMNAINAPYATLARELQAWRQSFDSHLKFQDTQKREYLAILQIIVMITAGSSKVMEPKNQKVENFLAKKEPVTSSVRFSITTAINIFCLLIEDPVLGRPFCNSKHKLVPIEYVMAIYLIHLHRSKLSLTQLSDAVNQMREHLRLNFKEPQFSTAFKPLLLYVTKSVTKVSLKSDGRGDTPADPLSVAAKLEAAVTSRSNEDVAPMSSSKRKRAECKEDDDDSEDDRPLARRKNRPGRPRKVVPNTDDDDEAVVKPAPPPKTKTPASRASVARPPSANAVASSSKAITTVKRGASTNTEAVGSKPRVTSEAFKGILQTATPTIKPSVLSRTKKSIDPAVSSFTLPTPRSASHIKLPTSASTTSNVSTNLILSPSIPSPSQTSSHSIPLTPIITDPVARLHSSGHYIKSEVSTSPALPLSATLANGALAPVGPSDRLAPIRAAKQRLLAGSSFQQPVVPTANPPAAATRDPRRPQKTQQTPPLVIPTGDIDPNDRLAMDCDSLLQGLPSISRIRSTGASVSRPPSPCKPPVGSSDVHISGASRTSSKPVPTGPRASRGPNFHAPLIRSASQSFASDTQQHSDVLHHARQGTDSQYSVDGGDRGRRRALSRERSTTGSSSYSRKSRSRSPRPVHRLPRNTPPPPSALYDTDRYRDVRGRNQPRYYDSSSLRRGADIRSGRGREVG